MYSVLELGLDIMWVAIPAANPLGNLISLFQRSAETLLEI